MEGVHRSIQFYAGSESRSRIKTFIIEGFTEFTDVQAGFMKRLMEE
jgi:hypothetical protein